MRGPVRIFLERYVLTACALPATLAVTEKYGVDVQHKLGVIAFGMLAAMSASIAVSQEKTTDSASVRRIFAASVVGTFSLLAIAVLFLYRGLPPRQVAPLPTPSSHERLALPPTLAEPKPDPERATAKTGAAHPSVPPPTASTQPDDFLEKYVDIGLKHPGDRPQWAFVISDRNRADFPELNAAATRTIGNAGYRNVSLFRPALVRDGKLEDLYSADPVLIQKVGSFCDGVIVAVVEQTPVPETAVQQVSTVEINIRVRVIAVPSATVKNEFSVLERGAGFTTREAEKNARERAAQALQSQLKDSL